MKRIFTLIFIMIGISMSILAASNGKCLLQHQGGCRIYNADAIETAIKNAVDGDTIFLTEGQFPGFTVDKKITVRGAGQGTKITGDINVSIPGNPTLSQTVLEGFNAENGNVILKTVMNGVKIKQGNFKYLTTNANNDDVIIDRCNISYELRQSSNIKGMTVLNSNVVLGRDYSSSDSSINFVNCYVYAYFIDWCAGTFINCFVYGRDYYSKNRFYNCNFIYSLISYHPYFDYSCTQENSYTIDSNFKDENPETLENLGYLGNDGTAVGRYGGVTPYTLDLAVPKVTENTIVLDPESKTLSVSLKVSAN